MWIWASAVLHPTLSCLTLDWPPRSREETCLARHVREIAASCPLSALCFTCRASPALLMSPQRPCQNSRRCCSGHFQCCCLCSREDARAGGGTCQAMRKAAPLLLVSHPQSTEGGASTGPSKCSRRVRPPGNGSTAAAAVRPRGPVRAGRGPEGPSGAADVPVQPKVLRRGVWHAAQHLQGDEVGARRWGGKTRAELTGSRRVAVDHLRLPSTRCGRLLIRVTYLCWFCPTNFHPSPFPCAPWAVMQLSHGSGGSAYPSSAMQMQPFVVKAGTAEHCKGH